MRVASLIVGTVLTFWTVMAVVHAMLTPSDSGSVIARAVTATVKWFAYAPLALMRTYARQHRWLTGMAPVSVLIQLVVYVAILIFTTGLIVYGTTDLSMMDSLYQSGATLTTLGIVEPVNVPSAITTFVAAFLGLVVIAIFIGYLLSIYGALASRESQMARLSVLAGEPAWGPELLARAHALGLPKSESPACVDWLNWACDVRLNLRMSPVTAEFRSPAPTRHWVVSLLTVMDAAALRISLTDDQTDPHAIQLLTEGTVALAVIHDRQTREHNWDVQKRIMEAVNSPDPHAVDGGLTDDEWNAGIASLRSVNYPLPADLEVRKRRFYLIRSNYFRTAYALALDLHAVPAPWSGPRQPALPIMRPEIAQRVGAQ